MDLNICNISNWAEQLANLMKAAWTQNEVCYFPYQPLITPEYWATTFLSQWQNGRASSYVIADGDVIVAHSSFVLNEFGDTGKFVWELGRWVCLPSYSGHGIMSNLVCQMVRDTRTSSGFRFRVEATQAHTQSQSLCERAGLRFAGIGILDKGQDLGNWDIIYYDNGDPEKPFVPKNGILGDPLGREIYMRESYQPRIREISKIITTTPTSPLPPREFHILPQREDVVRKIIELNL